MKRLALVVACCMLIVAVVIFTTGGRHKNGATAREVADLADRGVTPQQYLAEQKRVAAYKAKSRNEAPTDPNVVAPRLIREEHGAELLAWKNFYSRRVGQPVIESWVVSELAEARTTVTLNLTPQGSHSPSFGPANWAINFSLRRPLTPAENRVANSPRGVEAINADARQLEDLPKPQLGSHLPLRLFSAETLSPGAHKISVSLFPDFKYESWLIMRTGILDESLLRGKILATHPPQGPQTLRLDRRVAIFEEPFSKSTHGHRHSTSIYELDRLFNHGPVPILIGWRSGALTLQRLLRRPVQELTILRP
jgi:hypothetical protein